MSPELVQRMPLLQVTHLHIRLQTRQGPADAVRNLSFALEKGDTLGLVGESGCGKSLTALALMGLLPEGAQVSGSIQLNGQELVGMPERDLCSIRGDRIAMIFQEPMTALNPVHSVGRQIAEPLRLHKGLSVADARAKAVALLDRVGIADAGRRFDAYPHQFSGGQRQRVGIAMALACEPDVLVADEPTTALDASVQQQILGLIGELVTERGMGLVLISHDLSLIARHVSRMLVMYGGMAVESGPTAAVFAQPSHPYTQGLFGARPSLATPRGQRLTTIAGTVPQLADLPLGCPFAGRCGLTIEDCHTTVPEAQELDTGHVVRCLRLGETLTPALSREREEGAA